MTVSQRNEDGSFSDAQALGWEGSSIEFEVYGTGPFEWVAYDEDVCVAVGTARTRYGLRRAVRRAQKSLVSS